MNGLPGGVRAILWIQLVIALLLFALGWSQTSSLTFGRTPSLPDIVALAGPLVLVLLFWWGAARLWRAGNHRAARSLAILPLLAALLLAYAVGMV